MKERRLFPRIPVKSPVSLYHPELGRIQAFIQDISTGGIGVCCDEDAALGDALATNQLIQLRLKNMDVLFDMIVVRSMSSKQSSRLGLMFSG